MREADFDEFVSLLDDAYVFQKEKLSAQAKAIFFRAMSTYSLDVVRAAMSAHMLDPKAGKWAMQPADLMAQIQGSAGNDGRPGAEEAWAIALTSQDESKTVVWTQEAAEAFAICAPIMELGDEVGARMAFKEAYQRLVSQYRKSGVPVQWSASLGWDAQARTVVLNKAATAGLLSAPEIAGLLPAPATTEHDAKARAQIDKIRKMMADMGDEKAREFEAYEKRERNATAEAKRKQSELAANYPKKDAA